jgi:hypothetical protein
MSISGNKSYSNSNTSGSNSFKNLTSKIDENAQNILINTANISENTYDLTGINYTDVPIPTTILSNYLIAEELAEFESNVNILGTSNLSNTNITGDLLLIQ